MRLQAVYQCAHAQARQTFGRLIERLAVLVAARYLGEHAYLHKLVEQVVHDADRYARVELQLQRRVGLAALAEAVADAARYDEAKQRLVAVAEVFGLSLESVVVHVLIGVAQLRTEQAYQPRYLHPEHEQRQSGKRTVDGVVAAHPNLRVDVEELQTLHGYTGEYAGHNGATHLHLCVGHEEVERNEHARHDGVGHELQEELRQRTDNHRVLNLLEDSGEEDAYTRRDNYHYRHKQKHRRVVGDGAEYAARLLHLPDVVERALDVADKHHHGEEHEQQADAEEESALGVYEVGVDEADNYLRHLRLAGERLSEPQFDILVEAEAARYAEHHGEDGHDGEQRRVGEGCRRTRYALCGGELDGEQQLLQYAVEQETHGRHIVLADAPYSYGQKFVYVLQSFLYVHLLRLFALVGKKEGFVLCRACRLACAKPADWFAPGSICLSASNPRMMLICANLVK